MRVGEQLPKEVFERIAYAARFHPSLDPSRWYSVKMKHALRNSNVSPYTRVHMHEWRAYMRVYVHLWYMHAACDSIITEIAADCGEVQCVQLRGLQAISYAGIS